MWYVCVCVEGCGGGGQHHSEQFPFPFRSEIRFPVCLHLFSVFTVQNLSCPLTGLCCD